MRAPFGKVRVKDAGKTAENAEITEAAESFLKDFSGFRYEHAGIPKSDIVLGFHPPHVRPFTEYAAAYSGFQMRATPDKRCVKETKDC